MIYRSGLQCTRHVYCPTGSMAEVLRSMQLLVYIHVQESSFIHLVLDTVVKRFLHMTLTASCKCVNNY
jgi:hypothetical protein